MDDRNKPEASAQRQARAAQRSFAAALEAKQAADAEHQRILTARPAEEETEALAEWVKATAAAKQSAERAREELLPVRQRAEQCMVGLRVHVWATKPGAAELAPTPGMLHRLGNDGKWDLSIFLVGAISVRHAQPFSEAPKAGCWTWMPNGVV